MKPAGRPGRQRALALAEGSAGLRGAATPALFRPPAARRPALASCLALLSGAAFANGPFEPAASLPAPPLALQQALEPLRGQAVLVNFWASWCEPCRDEMPALVGVDTALPGLALVTIAVADRDVDIRRFLDARGLAPIVVADPDQAIARSWQVGLLPTTVLLDAGHRPVSRVRGELDWTEAAVRSRLDLPPPPPGPSSIQGPSR